MRIFSEQRQGTHMRRRELRAKNFSVALELACLQLPASAAGPRPWTTTGKQDWSTLGRGGA